jgi:hypothetical protein
MGQFCFAQRHKEHEGINQYFPLLCALCAFVREKTPTFVIQSRFINEKAIILLFPVSRNIHSNRLAGDTGFASREFSPLPFISIFGV